MNGKKLEPYIRLVSFLGDVLGPDYEIVLHDVCTPSKSIVAIVNNHISGRELGAPATDWAIKTIESREYLQTDYIASYNALSKGHVLIRSSMYFIKEGHELIGMLCINFDSSRYLDLSKSILQLCHPDRLVEQNYNFAPNASDIDIEETFSSSITELTDEALTEYFSGEAVPSDRLTKKERQGIVEILNKKGVFLVKGAVSQVAERLCCSESTIYRYLTPRASVRAD